MYDPMVELVAERQRKMRQAALDSHRLASIKPANSGLSQRVIYNLGGMLIAFGTWLRKIAPQPRDEIVSAASYSMPEGCS